jgi:hypothetical protein
VAISTSSASRASIKLRPFFVTRAKRRLRFKWLSSYPTDRNSGVICDQRIELTVYYSRQGYPKSLRRIRFKDPETGKTLIFSTNHFDLPALTVCKLYKMRWQVELFFKWIKQHLRIKAFFGTSENAVKTQIWIAVCTYVLVAIVRKRLELEISMHEMLQILAHSKNKRRVMDLRSSAASHRTVCGEP